MQDGRAAVLRTAVEGGVEVNVSRRWFIGGAASAAILPPRLFAVSSSTPLAGTPRVKIGVLSDIHIKNCTFDGVENGNSLRGGYRNVTFENCTINGELFNM